jgi:hypothetical protein
MPMTVQFEASRLLIKEAIAEAYYQAAKADADMGSTTLALEQIRTSLLTERDVFKIWQQLENAIGVADSNTQRPTFSNLRAWFREQLFQQQRQRLAGLFEHDSELGWRE